MSAIFENIIREISWNDTSLQEGWIRKIKAEDKKQRRALKRFHRWQANIMDEAESSVYTKAVEECVQRMAQRT